MLPISIIIPAYRDPRLKQCLSSIDEQVEVVVVLNGATREVEEIAEKHPNVVIGRLSEPGLPQAYNHGIELASHPNVLIMDSDCVFLPGTIRKLYEKLEEAPLAKGRVLFNFKSSIHKIVARVRHIHTAGKKAYSPPLAFRKSILSDIDGYFFHSYLSWTEDFDFDARVKKAKLPIAYDDSARIVHPELAVQEDLRSSFHYGQGHAEGVHLNIQWYKPVLPYSWKQKKQMFQLIKKKYGTWTAIYMMFWQRSFYKGYQNKIKQFQNQSN
ncbi:glycosyltransferase family 2 protein [Baia soyae]|uniref:Glycosyl transferase family 2 n=1 Tax=Baia soyae TaxID=1544746 RepID=A0A4R2RT82_9BACL|nr:glycosyltransferase family A protein [Baia soyae]TCP66514.1 glycosyl transferase family 2 [Baia soyae]